MFGAITNLAKAAASIALAPVAVVVDTVMLPFDAGTDKGAYERTTGLLSNAGECVEEALKPTKE